MPRRCSTSTNLRATKKRRLNPQYKTSISDIPDDAIRHIFRKLHVPGAALDRRGLREATDALAFASTCKRFLRIGNETIRGDQKILDALSPATLSDEVEPSPWFPDLSRLGSAGKHLLLSLEALRVPPGVGKDCLREILHLVCREESALEELSFMDAGSIDQNLAKQIVFVAGLRRLEVRAPGKALLQAMISPKCGICEIMLHKVNPESLEDVKTMFRVRKKTSSLCKNSLREFCISISLSTEAELLSIQRAIQDGMVEDFLLYLENFAQRDLCFLKWFKLISYTPNKMIEHFVRRLKWKLHKGSSFFHYGTEVEYEAMGKITVFPSLRTGQGAWISRDMSMHNVLIQARRGNQGQFVRKMEEAHTLFIPSSKIVSMYAGADAVLRKRCLSIIKEGGCNLSCLQVCVALNNSGHRTLLPKLTLQFIADILLNAPSITRLEISREVVEFTDTTLSEFMAVLRGCGGLETLSLRSARVIANQRMTFERSARFVKRLPLFLQLLQKHCPRLQNLCMEKYCRRKLEGRGIEKNMKSAIIAVERFESQLRSVDAESLRDQLKIWNDSFAHATPS